MKKTLIALAAVASTAAFAQNVTISGTFDAGLEKASSAAAWQMSSSRSGTTGVNFAGTEDLGGGLKAEFLIGTSFDSSYQTAGGAAAPTTLGNNNMYVGLAGGFGNLRLGRSLDPVFSVTQTANSTKGVSGYTSRANNIDGNGVYLSNQVLYVSPSMGGLQVQVSYAMSEVAGTDANSGALLSYGAGPVSVGVGYSKLGAAGALTVLSGSYNAGVAKVFGTYTNRDVAGDSTSYNLGVSAPMGAATLWADYTNNTITDTKGTQVGAKYALSKRTTAYVSYGHEKVGAAAATNGYGFGLQHNF